MTKLKTDSVEHIMRELAAAEFLYESSQREADLRKATLSNWRKKLKKAQKKEAAIFVSTEVLEKLKDDFKAEGFSVRYRNREGKQYLTIKKDGMIGYEIIAQTCKKILDKYKIQYVSTSGSWCERTLRLNPDYI